MVVDKIVEFRCKYCHRLLFKYVAEDNIKLYVEISCTKCKTLNFLKHEFLTEFATVII